MSGFKKGLLLIAITLVLLVTIELMFRVVYFVVNRPIGAGTNYSTYLPIIGYRKKPYSNHGIQTFDRYGLPLNEPHQERDLLKKPDDEFRVIMLGGSTVEGRFLTSSTDTLPARLERSIQKMFNDNGIGLKTSVINGGSSGYFSGQELASFIYQFLSTKPDMVVFFNGVNDFTVYGNNKSSAYDLFEHNYNNVQSEFFDSYNRFFTVSGIMYALIKNATAHSAAIDFLFKLLTRFDRFTEIVEVKIGGEASVKSVIEKYVPIHINRYHRNLLASIGVARQFDIDIAYILQPTMLGNEPLTKSELAILKAIPQKLKWHNIDYITAKRVFYQRSQDMFRTAISQYNKHTNVTVLDFSRLFDDKDSNIDFYGDRAHYLNIGREKIIKKMMQALSNQIMAKAKSRLN